MLNGYHLTQDITRQEADSLKTLIRIITRSQGDFSLILARCNYEGQRSRLKEQLKEQCPVNVKELILERSASTLYSSITEKLDQEQPPALMVSGLESVGALEQVLIAANLVREEFRKLSCPLILWVTDELLGKLIRLVPDFENWATSVEFASN